MGQTPSSSQQTPLAIPGDNGVHVVVGTRNTGNEPGQAELLCNRSRLLPIPQPLLAPPSPEDMSSALQGAQMITELRNRIGELLVTVEESGLLPSSSKTKTNSAAQSSVDLNPSDSLTAQPSVDSDGSKGISNGADGRTSSIQEMKQISNPDLPVEEEMWANLGLDYKAVKSVIESCTNGKALHEVLLTQKELMSLIVTIHQRSARLKKAMDANNEQARRTTGAIESLDKLNVALSEVQDNMESAVATANILGASHFAHDDEMCSFKNFLKHNPPRVV